MNPETTLTLDDCVDEVLGLLTGMDLTYDSSMDRYRSIARQLNRALRSNALEKEWSHYSVVATVGTAVWGERELRLPASKRPRIVSDDAVRLCHPVTGRPMRWAYFLPRDSLHKYADRGGLWASVTGQIVHFSRPFTSSEAGLDIQMPVMREPTMFRLPSLPEDPNVETPPVPQEIRDQPLDFPYPDVVTLRAAFYYAQTDPVMQPRVQTLEAQYKDLMYQIIERDDRNTDSPFQNEFFVPVENSINGGPWEAHGHPHSDERR